MPDAKYIMGRLGGAATFFFTDKSERPSFFSPYESGGDFALRAASIVTGPVVLTTVSVSALFSAAGELLIAISNLLSGEFTDSWKHLKEAGGAAFVAPILLIDALLSPLINLIDLIGGAINSCRDRNHEQFEEHAQIPTMN